MATAATTTATAQASHVPAQKKQSFKLKHAKDDARSKTNDTDLSEDEIAKRKAEKKKRRLDDDDDVDESKSDRLLALESEEGSANVHKAKKYRREKIEEGKDKVKGKRDKTMKSKRVSFSADTKNHTGHSEDDDDSATDGDIDSCASAPTDKDQDLLPAKKEKRKKRKEKRAKEGDVPGISASDYTRVHENPIVSYLNLYHENRTAWKFQKIRETQLFKSLFLLERVPTRYSAALLAYLQGLKGEGAKQRLCQAAKEAIKEDLEHNLSGENANGDATASAEVKGAWNRSGLDMKAYGNAIEAFRAWLLNPKESFNADIIAEDLDDGVRTRLEKRYRAELILFAVQMKLYSVDSREQKSTPGGKGQKKVSAGKKKRKNRTAVVDISSSSENSSDDDSSS